MNTAAAVDFCLTLKTQWRRPLDKISEDSIRTVVTSTASTVNNERSLYARAAIEFGDMQLTHPQYGDLAARLLMAQLYMDTPGRFEEAMYTLWKDKKLAEETWEACRRYSTEIEDLLRQHADADFNNFTYQGVTHLIKSYLMRSTDGTVIERPRYTMMRIALGLNPTDFDAVKATFEALIDGSMSLASPIMFNAGTTMPQMASCFIQTVDGNNVKRKYESLAETANISAMNGGVGMNIDGSDTQMFNIVVDRTIKDVPQGGAKNKKRPGAGAVYREPWETDFLKILANKRTEGGREDEKHKDLFIGMWTPNLFVERLRESASTGKPVMWSFFDGEAADSLRRLHGKEFEDLYHALEVKKAYKFQLPILKVFSEVCDTYKETGGPYTLLKDVANRRSNHNNRGTIRGSNLCAEVLEYSDCNETAVCTLSSICSSKFLVEASEDGIIYNFEGLGNTVRVAARNLDNTIDINMYPSKQTAKSHLSMRPIGIGPRDFQGLLLKAGLPFTSGAAKRLLDAVSAQMYFSALEESCNMAVERGPYPHFEGSMYSKGILQQDTTHVAPDFSCSMCTADVSCEFCSIPMPLPELDWEGLSKRIVQNGLRNSLVTAAMPTVGTAQIFGHYESADPLDSLVFLARVNSGTFQVVCRQLVEDLEKIGLWTPYLGNAIVNNSGSLEGMTEIPERMRMIYKTVWEIKQKERMKMAAIMGRYIDQGISFSVNLEDPTNSKYLTLLLFASDCDLKTANYYHRSKPATGAKKLVAKSEMKKGTPPPRVCKRNDPTCMACSS
ncbi:ribonucleoside-diphosphate reductase large subunit-like [Littorina saxatilis]|uniref:ribonucleoside-diphosphate reductase large subunit-like n=1 Tax=Littorina saxatilis TaxID=31220 RepID=UPI0038B5CAF0